MVAGNSAGEVDEVRLCPQLVLPEGCATSEVLEQAGRLGRLAEGSASAFRESLLDDDEGTLERAGLVARLVEGDESRELVLEPIPLDARLSLLRAGPRTVLQPSDRAADVLVALASEQLALALAGSPKTQLRARVSCRSYELSCAGGTCELRLVEFVRLRSSKRAGGRRSVRGLALRGARGQHGVLMEVLGVLEEKVGLRVRREGLYRSLLGPPRQVGPGSGTSLRAKDDAKTAARRICRTLFLSMLELEPGARVGLDDEYVHKMRVVLRRLQAALASFSPALPARACSRLRAELRWLGGVLGELRDCDVLVRNLSVWREQLGPDWLEEGWQDLGRRIEEKRQAARAELCEALSSRRHERLESSARRLFAAREGPSSGTKLCVAEVAAQALDKRATRFRARARTCLHQGGAEQVHALRIAGKHLRYTAELFRELFGESFARSLGRLEQLQERLGQVQDGVVLGQFATLLARSALTDQESRGAYAFSLGLLAGYAAANVRRDTRRVPRLLKRSRARREARVLASAASTLWGEVKAQ